MKKNPILHVFSCFLSALLTCAMCISVAQPNVVMAKTVKAQTSTKKAKKVNTGTTKISVTKKQKNGLVSFSASKKGTYTFTFSSFSSKSGNSMQAQLVDKKLKKKSSKTKWIFSNKDYKKKKKSRVKSATLKLTNNSRQTVYVQTKAKKKANYTYNLKITYTSPKTTTEDSSSDSSTSNTDDHTTSDSNKQPSNTAANPSNNTNTNTNADNNNNPSNNTNTNTNADNNNNPSNNTNTNTNTDNNNNPNTDNNNTNNNTPAHTTHTWDNGVVTKEPTCTEKGVKTYTCTVCGETKTEDIDAKGHQWDEGTVVKEPTFTEEGTIEYTCKVCGEKKTEELPKKDFAYNRGQFVKKLVEKLDINTDAGSDYHFQDTKDSEYGKYIEAAYGMNILPFTEQMSFSPNEAATREFAATAVINAMGYTQQDGEEVPSFCSDQDQLNKDYAYQDYVAIDNKYIDFYKDKKFGPNEALSEDDLNKMFDKMDSVNKETDAVGEGDQCDVKYADEVEEVSDKSYTATENDDGTYTVTMAANDTTKAYKEGDDLMLPANDQYQDGLALIVTKKETSGDHVFITGRGPKTDEIYDFIDTLKLDTVGQDVDESDIKAADGVKIDVVDDTKSSKKKNASKKNASVNIGMGKKLNITFPNKEFGNDNYHVKLSGSYTTRVPGVEVAVDLGFRNVKNFTIKLNTQEELKGGAEANVDISKVVEKSGTIPAQSKNFKLADIPIPVKGGLFTIHVTLSVHITAEGTAQFVYTVNRTSGFELKDGHFRRLKEVKKKKLDLTGTKGTAKMDIGLGVGLTMGKTINLVKLELHGGPVLNASITTHTNVDPAVYCADCELYIFLTFDVSTDSLVGKAMDKLKIKTVFEIFTEENSPILFVAHYENGKKVEKCTFVKDDDSGGGDDDSGGDTGGKTEPTKTYSDPNSGKDAIDNDFYSYSNDSSTGGYRVSVKSDFADQAAKDKDGTFTGTTPSGNKITWTSGQPLPNPNPNGEYNDMPITSMARMFDSHRYITLDLSHFNTSSVKDMYELFYEQHSLTKINLKGLDTSNVTDMAGMFAYCDQLRSIDLSPLDTSKVTNMAGMFKYCTMLEKLDLSSLKTSRVTDMSGMFEGCNTLEKLDLSPLNTSHVNSMSSMFSGCGSLETLDVSKLNTSRVTSMNNMFGNCTNLTKMDLTKLDTSKVTDFESLFNKCTNIESIDLSNLNTLNVAYMESMFSGCTELTSVNLSGLDTSEVENMSSMFNGCSSLQNVDITSLDVSKVKNMDEMFADCSSLKSLDLSNFYATDASYLDSMFKNCSSLTELDLAHFDRSYHESYKYMFDGCTNLKTIKNFKVKSNSFHGYDSMFAHCNKLESVDLSDFEYTNGVGGFTDMFYMTSSEATNKPVTIYVKNQDTADKLNDSSVTRIDANNLVIAVKG